MKVFLTGSFNAEILARQLSYYGVETKVDLPPKVLASFNLRSFDVIYSVCFMRSIRLVLSSKFFRKNYVVHFIGSDALEYTSKRGFGRKSSDVVLRLCDEVFYVTEELKQLVGLGRGRVIPIPVDTRMFRETGYHGEKRYVLYYCPNPEIYRSDWIAKYAVAHPDETITILGSPNLSGLSNVKVISHVPYRQMPKLYQMHRRLIRMTTHDGCPKMPYEALLCGLEVMWNGKRVTTVPKEMLMEDTVPRLISILESLKSRA